MNSVNLTGRLARDPDVRYGAQSQMAVARFSLAINRGKDKKGEDMGADFPNITCFGKTAEAVERYLKKGMQIAVTGRLHTDSYEKDGKKVFTTEVFADRIDFLEKKESSKESGSTTGSNKTQRSGEEQQQMDVPSGFDRLTDDDIPF